MVVVTALWSGNAQAQVLFRETFGSTTTTLPIALSTADGNYLNACLNGQIANTAPDAASDGAASTHYLFHNTANCTYSGAWAVWRTLSTVPVEPDKAYVFSYWTTVVNRAPHRTWARWSSLTRARSPWSIPSTRPIPASTTGGDVVITESSLPSGWVLSDATCTSGGVTVGNRSGSSYTIPGSLVDGGAEGFICNFTNIPSTNLRIDKTAAPTTVRSGDTVTYTIALNNDGPGPGGGAVVTDQAIPGVDCSAGTLTCGDETGGTICPASSTVAGLQGAGLIIPTLPMGGSLQFALTCTVTASGLP